MWIGWMQVIKVKGRNLFSYVVNTSTEQSCTLIFLEAMQHCFTLSAAQFTWTLLKVNLEDTQRIACGSKPTAYNRKCMQKYTALFEFIPGCFFCIEYKWATSSQWTWNHCAFRSSVKANCYLKSGDVVSWLLPEPLTNLSAFKCMWRQEFQTDHFAMLPVTRVNTQKAYMFCYAVLFLPSVCSSCHFLWSCLCESPEWIQNLSVTSLELCTILWLPSPGN